MWISRREIRRLSEQVKTAEARALAAESALADERRENRRELRHFASMWLRHNKSLPLPPTLEEKAEAAEKIEEQKNAPPLLTDVEIAMRDANRRDAAAHGINADDADRDFLQKVLNRIHEMPD